MRKPVHHYIINALQAEMLEALRAAPEPLTLTQIEAAVSKAESACMRSMADLRERELVDVVRKGAGRLPMLIGISRTGSRALAAHKRRQAAPARDVVAPPTYNTAGQPYVPPRQVYYRNEGNRHIASRGFPC